MTRKIVLAALTCGLTLAMLAQATPSFAILPWYDFRTGTWQSSRAPRVAVAPVAVAVPVMAAPVVNPCNPCAPAVAAPPACSPCASACSTCPTTACSPVVACSPCTQTCASPVINYVAETAYRVQVVNVPVTTLQPVVTPGACGTCVTAFMPVTTMVAQTQQVPFTTYRPVMSFAPAPCAAPCASCAASPCASGQCPGGACVAGNCAAGNCASGECGGGAVATVSGTIDETPSLPAGAAIPTAPAPQPAPQVAPQPEPQPQPASPPAGAGYPSLYPESASNAPRSLDTIPSSAPARKAADPAPLQDLKQDGLKPVAPPQLLDPNDKTAMRIDFPARARVRMVNDSGWHAPR